MECPNCKTEMKATEFGDDIFYICYNDNCRDEVQEKYNMAFVMVCYNCRHKEHKTLPKESDKESHTDSDMLRM